jgi:hypothetical protein
MNGGRDRVVRGAGRGPYLVVLASLTIAISGCAPEEDVNDGVVETAHLRITTTTDNPICAGTPLLLESEVVRISEALELPLWATNDKLEVRFGFDAVDEVCTQHDPDEISGCVSASGMILAAKELAYTASHELVHAVRLRNLSLVHPMFEEGLAEVLSGSDGLPRRVSYPHNDSYIGVGEMLSSPERDSAHYVWGASFVSWLWETHSQSTLMAFMNDPRLPDDEMLPLLFEEYFDQSLTEADQAWAIDERPDPFWGAPCIPERTWSLADGPVEISGDLDCREPTVYGAAYFMSIWPMCLEVPENTRVRITMDSDHGRLSVLSVEPCDPGPVGAEAHRDKYMEAGEVLEEDISGCTHRLTFSSQEPGFPATPYTIRIDEIPR